jgi:biotin carboxyl carrier protein
MARTTAYFAQDLADPKPMAQRLEVESLGNGGYAVTLEGRRYELESLVLPHGSISMIVENEAYFAEFYEAGDEVDVMLRGHVARVDIVDERRLRQRAASAIIAEGKQVITAPMPGKVVKVFVKVGDEVVEGQGLVVVEAMKMENELKAPRAGKVTEVLAKEGTPVENGAKLVVVE